jgi:hypothetical protein
VLLRWRERRRNKQALLQSHGQSEDVWISLASSSSQYLSDEASRKNSERSRGKVIKNRAYFACWKLTKL